MLLHTVYHCTAQLSFSVYTEAGRPEEPPENGIYNDEYFWHSSHMIGLLKIIIEGNKLIFSFPKHLQVPGGFLVDGKDFE